MKFGIALAAFATLTAQADAKKPHIVLLLADDYGWANFGVHRDDLPSSDPKMAEQIKREVFTPTLDSLSRKEGVLLDRHYSYRICGPRTQQSVFAVWPAGGARPGKKLEPYHPQCV
jgi:arylsulfatase I/J